MINLDDKLRSFGMPGYLVVGDLKSVEDPFDFGLGHVPRAITQTSIDYYPQF